MPRRRHLFGGGPRQVCRSLIQASRNSHRGNLSKMAGCATSEKWPILLAYIGIQPDMAVEAGAGRDETIDNRVGTRVHGSEVDVDD